MSNATNTNDKSAFQNVKLPCRISYATLAEMRKPDESRGPQYSVELRIAKDDEATITVIRKAILACVRDKFGDDKTKWPGEFRDPNFIKSHLSVKGQDGFPLRDGDKKFDNPEYHGQVFLRVANSKKQPYCGFLSVIDGVKKRFTLTKKEDIEEHLYSGCYAFVFVNFYGYAAGNNHEGGVGCSLQGVVKFKDGERLGGSAPLTFDDDLGEEEAFVGSSASSADADDDFDL